jgi:hypothetical protein
MALRGIYGSSHRSRLAHSEAGACLSSSRKHKFIDDGGDSQPNRGWDKDIEEDLRQSSAD